MAIFVDEENRFDRTKMMPGERVKIYAHPNIYVFEMDASRDLILDMNASIVPEELMAVVKRNRDVQEILCSSDIEMKEMQIYLHIKSRYMLPGTLCLLYPKAPCASLNISNDDLSMYTYMSNSINLFEPA